MIDATAPTESAQMAGLRYVNDVITPGIRRHGTAGQFRYIGPEDRRVTPADRQRIRALAVPPAWKDVWICPFANGHLQATGRDAKGRKQYRYHSRWREVRDEVKYGRLLAFADALPRIRSSTELDLKRDGLPREKVLATVVQLLARTFIRVGNEEYARSNGAIGLTTMRDGHARINGSSVRFEFRGKSGVKHTIDLRDKRLTRIIRACRDLPGHELFQWVDAGGVRQSIGSADVNTYLRDLAGSDFTAKDFRTWAGTVLAARALREMPTWKTQAEARRQVVRAVEFVAGQLGNTKAVCRKSYIHPAVFEMYTSDGTCIRGAYAATQSASNGLEPEEAAVVRLIARHARTELRRPA
jgi:DNA topoisomerase-1